MCKNLEGFEKWRVHIMRCLCRHRASVLLVGILGLSLGACDRDHAAATPTVAPELNQLASHVSQNGLRTTTSQTLPVSTRSFAGLMQELKPREQTQVQDWYRRIGGPPMDAVTPVQIAWMQARHYPMPADIARAASMSMAELKAEAGTGNTTAQILYAAHLLTKYSAGLSAHVPYPNKAQIHTQIEIDQILPQILASGSPYAGYVYAARKRLMSPNDEPAVAAAQLAGLVWATKFGDVRANRLLNTATVQAVDAWAATTEMDSMLEDAIHANQTLLSPTVIPIPTPDY